MPAPAQAVLFFFYALHYMLMTSVLLPRIYLLKLMLPVFLIAASGALQTHAQQLPDGLDSYIEDGMADWEIPGLSIAVVQKDELIYARGFGVQKLDEALSRAVDEHTLFGIASVSKAFTATAMAMLVEEGTLDWDDPITDYLPDFRLYDPYITAHLSIRDALSHRSGLGRMTGNRIEFMPNRPREALLHQMRYMQPEAPFRQEYVYSNMMYMVAGEVIRAVSGKSWDDFIYSRIFEPLDMNRSNTSITEIPDDERNAAWPHQYIKGEVLPIPRRNFDNVGASASINSTARDISRWMRFHLGTPGTLEGQQVMSADALSEIYQPVTPLPNSDREQGLRSYAMGWTAGSWNGRTIYRHGGATDGMNTNLILIPEEEVGIFITTNTFNRFMHALGRTLKDFYTGGEAQDWHQEFLSSYETQLENALSYREEVHDARIEDAPASHDLTAYVGRYHDDLYDVAEVRMGEDGLELHFWDDETQVADLEHWHHDTFRASWRNPAKREKFVWFQMGHDGQPERLNVTFTLRPLLLQAGLYPTNYYRVVEYSR